MPDGLVPNFVAAVIFAALGIVVLAISLVVVDKLTPYSLWKEILEEHNTALAVLLGLLGVGISIIIAAAIH